MTSTAIEITKKLIIRIQEYSYSFVGHYKNIFGEYRSKLLGLIKCRTRSIWFFQQKKNQVWKFQRLSETIRQISFKTFQRKNVVDHFSKHFYYNFVFNTYRGTEKSLIIKKKTPRLRLPTTFIRVSTKPR